MRCVIAAPPDYRFKQYTCPRCSKRNKQTENVTAPSPGISEPGGSASLVPHEEKTPIQRKQMCTECGKPRWKSEWCSNEHFETTTGYCNECAMTRSTCEPEPTLRKKEEYNEPHWKNVKKMFCLSSCLLCQAAKQTEKFQCARCTVNGKKQWFDKSQVHPKDLDNCQYKKMLEKLQCRQP